MTRCKTIHNRLTQWMLGFSLYRRYQTIQFIIRHSTHCFNSSHLRRTISQCTCFIKGHCINLCQSFHNITAAHEEAVLARIRNSRHYRSWRSQYKSARTEYNEDGYGADDFASYYIGTNCCQECNHYDPRSPTVSKANDFRIAWICRFNELNHTLNRAVFALFSCSHIKCTELVHRTREYFVTNRFIDRHRLASHNGLVDSCITSQNCAIYRDYLAWQHANYIAYCYDVCRQHLFFAVTNNTRCGRRQFNETFNARLRFRYSELFEHCTELHDESNLCGCKYFTDGYSRDESQGYQEVCFYVELFIHGNRCAPHDRQTT